MSETGSLISSHSNNKYISKEWEIPKNDCAVRRQYLSYWNLCYTIGVGLPKAEKRRKRILHSISGIFYSGLNAIMGPTGGGKTTLLDVLASRKNRRNISGQILINDRAQPKNFKCMAAYVVQDDYLSGILTIRENIYFSANLRLPLSIGFKEKKRRVNDLIERLGLTQVADSRVGTDLARGISGGERKRCHIAMELINSPRIIFLDEPTTGLDAFSAVRLMKQLKTFADEGRIVITSIHQPRYSIYKLFDSVTLLSQGRTVYHGPANNTLQYFDSLGYQCEEHENPADFFLDTIARVEMEAHQGSVRTNQNRGNNTGIEGLQNALTDRYSTSYLNHNKNIEVQNMQEKAIIASQKTDALLDKKPEYANYFFWQILVIAHRTIKETYRRPGNTLFQIAFPLIQFTIMGIVSFQSPLTKEGLQNRVGGVFQACTTNVFSNIPAIVTFIQGRALFIHENSSGYYRVSSYFISKTLLDLISVRYIPSIIAATVFYFLAGYKTEITHYLFFILTLLLITTAASGIARFFGALIPSQPFANAAASGTFILMITFSGVIYNVREIFEWLVWLIYLCLLRLGIASLLINELVDLDFCSDAIRNATGNNTCLHKEFQVANGLQTVYTHQRGENYLESQEIPYGTKFDLWMSNIILALISVVVYSLTYVALRLINKKR